MSKEDLEAKLVAANRLIKAQLHAFYTTLDMMETLETKEEVMEFCAENRVRLDKIFSEYRKLIV